jgi:hypothetical protein
MNMMRIYPEIALIFFVQVKLKLVLNIAIFLMANKPHHPRRSKSISDQA